MTNIKLNPLVDLGLASDPNYNPANDPSSKGVEVQVDTNVPDMQVNAYETQVAKSSAFEGISNINQNPASPASEQVAVVHAEPVNGATTVTQAAVGPEVKAVSSSGSKPGLPVANILFFLAITLFLVSLGALIFFILKYFKVI